MSKKRDLLLGFVGLIYAMFLLFYMISNFTGRTNEHWRFFYAFTQQSNILVLVWLVLFGFGVFSKRFANTKVCKFIMNKTTIVALTVYISITFFIVAFVLTPVYSGKFNPFSSSGEFLLHNATPMVMWLFFFLVPGIGALNIKKSLLSLIYPLLYVVANLIIGGTIKYADGSKAYAYGFINPDTYSNIFIFIIVIIGLVLIFSLFTLGLTLFKKYINKNYHEIQLEENKN